MKINTKPNSYSFRTREIRKTAEFPVDLYSIDMRAILEIQKEKNIQTDYYDISLLDVVLQDSDDFSEKYHINSKGINVASLEFLLDDFHKTYMKNDDRALARIWSGKDIKDIHRYNILYNNL